MNAINRSGRWIFSFAIVALGAENILCAHHADSIPALPFLPPIPWRAILFGILWIACGVGLLIERWLRASAYALGATYIFWTIVHVAPQYIANPGDMGLRTIVFEPLSLACIALLLPGPAVTPRWLTLACRAIVAVAMIVFGVDHFLGLAFIASLIPNWIPWHEFWVVLFGIAMIAATIGIGIGVLERWSWIGLGLMFAIWVVTLHIPRTLGFYHIPGATTDPDEWSSLFIAIGLWGGPWALARNLNPAPAEALAPSPPSAR
ncbi:MAG: hypothetical protein WBP85_07155 [Terracidiphilus sp.]